MTEEMKIRSLEVDLNGGDTKKLFVTEETTGVLLGSAEINHKLGFTFMVVKNYIKSLLRAYGHSQVSRPFEEEIDLAKSIILENYIKKNGKEKSL